jgi:hypothetical protein
MISVDDVTVYIGFDSTDYGQVLAFQICKRSILKHNPDIKVNALIRKDMIDNNIFSRTDNTGSTEFTYTRFYVPYLNNYKGIAIFCDSDFLWTCDIMELLQFIDIKKQAVACVKHDFNPTAKFKMNNLIQESYPKKNWSSLLVFNCEHELTKNLTLKKCNKGTPKYLHRFEWCLEEDDDGLNDNIIGSIPHTYNYLVNWYSDIKEERNQENKLPKAIHWTDGGYWHTLYKNTEFVNIWINMLTKDEKINVDLYLDYMNEDDWTTYLSKNQQLIVRPLLKSIGINELI